MANKIRCLLGNLDHIDDAPETVFHPLRIDFLASLSNALMTDPRSKAFPDVVTFAFWCRRANIQNLAKAQDKTRLRIGLGLIFHVSPSNVPINFAYSLVFAFLSGNASVVRLPSKEAAQADLLIDALGTLLADDKYAPLRPTIHLVRFGHADYITEFWLRHAQGRIVWGGDATVAHLRSLKMHPRSREIAFVDRYSLAAIAAKSLLDTDEATLHSLCTGLYNDIYQMDQSACSSPQLLVWVGRKEEIYAAQSRLWPMFETYVRSKYTLEPVNAMDKFVGLCGDVIDHANVLGVTANSPVLTRVALSELVPQQWQQRGYFGTVHEVAVDILDAIAPIIDPRFQTLTTFGFKHDLLRNFVTDNRLAGIDRIVPIGRALDMGFVWDGFDTISCLSRLVDIQQTTESPDGNF
ncbi:MAG: acyl-CoA reductase [Comamonadaceae bacterium]|nr:acyl-CoA reductase [Comamonadaceae bacterium]